VDEVARDLQLRGPQTAPREESDVRSVARQEAASRPGEQAQDLNANREFLTEKAGVPREEQFPSLPPSRATPSPQRSSFFHIGIGALLAFLLLPALGIIPERVVATLRGMLGFGQRPASRLPVEERPPVQETPHPSGPPTALAGQPLLSATEFTVPQKEKGEGLQQEETPLLAPPPPRSSAAQRAAGSAPFLLIPSGTTISEIVRKNYQSAHLLAVDVLKEVNPHVKDLDYIQAGEKIWLPPLNRETLVRQEPDGSYRLVVASFRSRVEAERFSQKARAQGYRVRVLPQRVSGTILLQRVEIHRLENREAVTRAWELSPVRDALPAQAETHAGEGQDPAMKSALIGPVNSTSARQ